MYKINKISPDTNNFTQILPSIDKTIKSLYFIGKLPEQRIPSVAIVGTRKPTPYGREVTYQLSHELARKGVAIVSGLALGTDGIAHQAALDAGGVTIAVLPGGVDAIYPYTHRNLAKQIVDREGAVLSECEPGSRVYPSSFIRRNRIVSALADCVLITEAATRSGTLATANFALGQGKSVMAVPGNITSPTSSGCNRLIQQGAKAVTAVEDILEEIGYTDSAPVQIPLVYSIEEQAIVALLLSGIRDGDSLQKKSGLEPALFSQTLTMLEIEGKIRALGANQWGLK